MPKTSPQEVDRVDDSESLGSSTRLAQKPAPSTSFFEGAHHFSVGSLTVTSNGSTQLNRSTQLMDDLRQEIRAWLKAPTSSFLAIHRASMEQRTEETGTWFLESSEFQEYIQKEGCTLWCTGKPGSGKTILASTCIKQLQDLFRCRNDAAIVYVYLRYSEKRTLREVLSALLDQLLVSDDAVVRIDPSYRQMKKDGVEYTKKEIVNVLKDMFACLARVFAVIDGLDEASDEVKDGLLEALTPLGINLLIFSRPLELYTHYTPHALLVSIQARTDDIALFISEQFRVSSKLKRVLGGRPDLAVELSNRIKRQADGMFLLAKLQLDSILRDAINVKTLIKSLEKMPSGIEEMYRLTLQRINEQSKQLTSIAHRLSVWLLYQRDPLRVKDMQHALAVCAETQAFEDQAITHVDMILSACHGLVTVSDNEFRFIHYSAKEFLRANVNLLTPYPHSFLAATCVGFLDPHIAHLQTLIQSTKLRPFLNYALDNWWHHTRLASQKQEPLHPVILRSLRQHPFYPLSSTGETVPSLTVAARYRLVEIITSKALTFPGPVSRPGESRYSTPFHVAAYHGYFDAFMALLLTYGTQGLQLWTSTKEGIPSILHTVASVASDTAVPFLQRLFALVDSPDTEELQLHLSDFNLNVQDHRGKTPLMVVCERGRVDTARLLLARQDIQVHLCCEQGLNTFHCAMNPVPMPVPILPYNAHTTSHRGTKSEIACLLITSFPDLDVETTDRHGNTAFMAACKRGYERVVDHILTHRPNDRARLVTHTNGKGMTALMVAINSRNSLAHDNIIKLLLEHGSDLHAKCIGSGRTPFLHAVSRCCAGRWRQRHPALQLGPLLDIDPSIIGQRDRKGRTALMIAARNGSIQPIRFLSSLSLSQSSSQFLNARDFDGRSALMHALGHKGCHRIHCIEVVKVLLACPSLEVHLPDRMGRRICEVACSTPWLYRTRRELRPIGYLRDAADSESFDSIFQMLYLLLDVEGGWDAHSIRKAVIAGVRYLPSWLVYRLLLEDWVAHSFVWSIAEPDTIVLLAQTSIRSFPCRAAVSIVFHCLGLLEPSLLPQGAQVLDHGGLAEAFCPEADCEWHGKSYYRRVRLRYIFNKRRSYTLPELEHRIRKSSI